MSITDSEIESLLQENNISNPMTVSLYQRILTSYKWYDILEMLTDSQLSNALSPSVIKRIYSKDLQSLYRYAAERLNMVDS